MATVEISIRPARPRDFLPLAALCRESYLTLGQGYFGSDVLEHAANTVNRSLPGAIAQGQLFVAGTSARLLGCAGWSTVSGQTKTGELRLVAVSPKYSGAGVASRLGGHCEQEARRNGTIHFDCVSTMMAEGLYAKLGYSHVRFGELRVGPHPFPIVYMTKRLDGAEPAPGSWR